MSKHSPGPFKVMPESECPHRWVIAMEDGSSVGECSPAGPWISDEEADANARLFAAAPTMLAVLHQFVESSYCTCRLSRVSRGSSMILCAYCGARSVINEADPADEAAEGVRE